MNTGTVVLEGELLPKVVEIGDRLRNGAIVLQTKKARGYDDGLIVLALRGSEFVTWVCTGDGSEASWGHYFFGDLAKALADFEARR